MRNGTMTIERQRPGQVTWVYYSVNCVTYAGTASTMAEAVSDAEILSGEKEIYNLAQEDRIDEATGQSRR